MTGPGHDVNDVIMSTTLLIFSAAEGWWGLAVVRGLQAAADIMTRVRVSGV